MTDSEKPTLKPCPCCGGEAWFDKCWGSGGFEMGYRDRQFYSVRCRACDLRTPAIANPKSPVDIWNRRPDVESVS